MAIETGSTPVLPVHAGADVRPSSVLVAVRAKPMNVDELAAGHSVREVCVCASIERAFV